MKIISDTVKKIKTLGSLLLSLKVLVESKFGDAIFKSNHPKILFLRKNFLSNRTSFSNKASLICLNFFLLVSWNCLATSHLICTSLPSKKVPIEIKIEGDVGAIPGSCAWLGGGPQLHLSTKLDHIAPKKIKMGGCYLGKGGQMMSFVAGENEYTYIDFVKKPQEELAIAYIQILNPQKKLIPYELKIKCEM